MHKIFTISVILKGFNGLLEILVGVAAIFITHDLLVRYVDLLTRQELLQDPGDVFANYLVNAANSYSFDVQIFIAAYLLIHGVLKVWLVISLLKERMWAYPTAIVVFSLFVVYQMYEYFKAPHISLLLLSILDVVIIYLTYLEYRSHKKRLTAKETIATS